MLLCIVYIMIISIYIYYIYVNNQLNYIHFFKVIFQ
nr:MAG TPA: hypothetical protein [Caudoviricetes sp.]